MNDTQVFKLGMYNLSIPSETYNISLKQKKIHKTKSSHNFQTNFTKYSINRNKMATSLTGKVQPNFQSVAFKW